jgi:uncharacterized protein (DUF433 family)
VLPPWYARAMASDLEPVVVPLRRDGHGVLRVGGTRVTLESVLGAYLQGESAEGIVERFPTLHPADVHATLAWYLRHRDEAGAYLEQARRNLDAGRDEAVRRDAGGLTRARLLGRSPE